MCRNAVKMKNNKYFYELPEKRFNIENEIYAEQCDLFNICTH